MGTKIIISAVFLFCLFLGFAQINKDKTNPILFAEMFVGYSGGSSEGWTGGFTVNYQFKDNLITGRSLGLSHLRYEGLFLVIPIYKQIEAIDEYKKQHKDSWELKFAKDWDKYGND